MLVWCYRCNFLPIVLSFVSLNFSLVRLFYVFPPIWLLRECKPLCVGGVSFSTLGRNSLCAISVWFPVVSSYLTRSLSWGYFLRVSRPLYCVLNLLRIFVFLSLDSVLTILRLFHLSTHIENNLKKIFNVYGGFSGGQKKIFIY